MKKLLLLGLILLCTSNLLAESFSSVNIDGQTIYYKITSSTSPYKVAITYSGTNFYFSNTYSGSIIIPDSVTYCGITYSVSSIGDYAFFRCSGLTSVTIGNSVTYIDTSAFEECTGLTNINIPNSITNIYYAAFSRCIGLTSIIIPNSVNSIGHSVFSGCSNLTSINIPNSVTSIGDCAFSGCSSLTSINIPDSITSIADGTFGGSGLTSINIPNSVTSIGMYAFSSCNELTSIIIPNSVTSIYSGAFTSCNSLDSIIIPNSVNFIGEFVFGNCHGLKSVNISNSINSIKEFTFFDCIGLTSIDIPNSVITIENNAFEDCNALISINIGNSVTSIKDSAFQNCTNLDSITCYCITPPTIHPHTFHNLPYDAKVFIPCNTLMSYQNSQFWSNFSNIIGYNNDTTEIYAKICQGQNYNENGFNISTSGLHTIILQTTHGCDSIVNLNLNVIEPPIPQICMVTVDGNNHNVVIWQRNEVVDFYNIYKESNQNGQYDLMATIPYDSLLTWIDTSSNPLMRAYKYKLSTTDSCNESALSTLHKTIHLTINRGINCWNLIWTSYEGINFETYNIYRGNNSNSLELIATLSSDNTSFTDFDNISDIVYYQIEIILNNSCASNKDFSSILSNIASNKNIGISNIENGNNSFSIYPNPTDNKAILKIEGLTNVSDVIVYDLYGRAIKSYKLNVGQRELEIDVKGFAKGVYNIKIVNDKNSITKKLIVR